MDVKPPACGRCADTRLVCGEHPRFPAAARAAGHEPHEGEQRRCPECCPVAFGAAISEDRRHAAVVAAGRSAAGKVLVDLSPFYGHPALVVGKLAELAGRHEPVGVVVNPKSQSGTMLRPLAEAGITVTKPSAEDVAAAHGEFLDLVAGHGLEHLDQEPLTKAVRAAQQRPLAGANAWEPRVGVDQCPLVAANLAVWGFLCWERVSSPGAFAL